MSKSRISLVLLSSVFLGVSANAATFTGSLTYTPAFPADSADELSVQPGSLQWANSTVSISWAVTDTDNSHPDHPWKYTYTFGHTAAQAGINHVLIEASDTFTIANITGLTGARLDSVGAQTVASGNPGMPEDVYGLRFVPLMDYPPLSMTWTFYSDRAPVWGDFYARNGGGASGTNSAYNYNHTAGVENGFLSPDADPDLSPASGHAGNHYYYHILRPDSVLVPEPASLLLLGLAGFIPFRTRRRLRA